MAKRDDSRNRTATRLAGRNKISWERLAARDWHALGGGRYAVWVGMPWGVEVPALVQVTSLWGWPRRPEARDPLWTAYTIGPAIVAVRLISGLRGIESGEDTSAAALPDPVPDPTPAADSDDTGCRALELDSSTGGRRPPRSPTLVPLGARLIQSAL